MRIEEKIKGGKLVSIEVSDGRVVRITGDFFAHPEELIGLIENELSKIDPKIGEENIANALEKIVKRENGEMIGISPTDLARIFLKAIE